MKRTLLLFVLVLWNVTSAFAQPAQPIPSAQSSGWEGVEKILGWPTRSTR